MLRFIFICSALLFLHLISYAQNEPRLWVEGTSNIVYLENEDFSSGLGSFTNSGTVNWSASGGSAISGSVFPGQNAILNRSITVPPGYSATLTYSTSYGTTFGPDGVNDISRTLELNGVEVDANTGSFGTQTIELSSGINLLQWIIASGGDDTGNLSLYDVEIFYNATPSVRIQDGTEGPGKVLTSDSEGNASWKSVSELNSSENGIGLAPLLIDGQNTISEILKVRNSDGIGIYSYQNDSYGVDASYNGFSGIRSSNNGSNGILTFNNDVDGIYSFGNDAYAGYFSGYVTVNGMLSKSAGTFKIDHPLDPENKFLYHSFVESPDMMNVYNGNAETDDNGIAEVQMPDYFEALNSEFRYQLTVIGQFAQAIIKEEMEDGRFLIQTDIPNVKVSWQVTGIRQDNYAEMNRVVVEEEKPDEFKGFYLHPEAYDLPFERGFDFVKNGHRSLEDLLANPR